MQADEKANLEAELQSLRVEANEVDASARDWAGAVEMADAITRKAAQDLNACSDDISDHSGEVSMDKVINNVNENEERDEWSKAVSDDSGEKEVDNSRTDLSSPLGERDLSSSNSSSDGDSRSVRLCILCIWLFEIVIAIAIAVAIAIAMI
eukprot:COSAG02_NODE_498_length_21087_cov_33.272394_5_plen_151_part_00